MSVDPDAGLFFDPLALTSAAGPAGPAGPVRAPAGATVGASTRAAALLEVRKDLERLSRERVAN